MKYNTDSSFKSSVDKFFTAHQFSELAAFCNAQEGDLILLVAGKEGLTRKAASELRLELGNRLGLRNPDGVQAFMGGSTSHCLSMMRMKTVG